MFSIYETREDREKLLHDLKELDPCVALVIAFLDFEWTVRRCILALGKSPTKDIHAKFSGELPIDFCREDETINQAEKKETEGVLYAVLMDIGSFGTRKFCRYGKFLSLIF